MAWLDHHSPTGRGNARTGPAPADRASQGQSSPHDPYDPPTAPGHPRLDRFSSLNNGLSNEHTKRVRPVRQTVHVLPESLRELSDLEELDLDQNQLDTIPSWLGEL